MRPYNHKPVLLAEVLAALQPAPGQSYLDATLGGGGHAAALLKALQPNGKLLGLDADPNAIQAATAFFQTFGSEEISPNSYTLCQTNFQHLTKWAKAQEFELFDGILFDLGVSSPQLDTPERGFAFRTDGPLDMRLDPTSDFTAADLLATWDEKKLADTIYLYGEERKSRQIARRIVERRQRQPIETTTDLANLVAQVLPQSFKARAKIHPATRTFQALRIAVNQELERLERALPQAVALLRPGGKLAVISFHSLEDRIVKLFFRAESGYGGNEASDQPLRLRILTKKPIQPQAEEIQANPRSRSAKLRVAERICAEN